MIVIILIVLVLGLLSWIFYVNFYENKIKKGEKEIEISHPNLKKSLEKYYKILKEDKTLKKEATLYNQLKGKGNLNPSLLITYKNPKRNVYPHIKITKDKVLVSGENEVEEVKHIILKHPIKIKELECDFYTYVTYRRKTMWAHLLFYKLFKKQ